MILTKKKLDELFLEHPSLDDEAPIVIKTLCTTEQKDKFWVWDIAVHDSDGSLKLEVVGNNTATGSSSSRSSIKMLWLQSLVSKKRYLCRRTKV